MNLICLMILLIFVMYINCVSERVKLRLRNMAIQSTYYDISNNVGNKNECADVKSEYCWWSWLLNHSKNCFNIFSASGRDNIFRVSHSKSKEVINAILQYGDRNSKINRVDLTWLFHNSFRRMIYRYLFCSSYAICDIAFFVKCFIRTPLCSSHKNEYLMLSNRKLTSTSLPIDQLN